MIRAACSSCRRLNRCGECLELNSGCSRCLFQNPNYSAPQSLSERKNLSIKIKKKQIRHFVSYDKGWLNILPKISTKILWWKFNCAYWNVNIDVHNFFAIFMKILRKLISVIFFIYLYFKDFHKNVLGPENDYYEVWKNYFSDFSEILQPPHLVDFSEEQKRVH